MRENIKVLELDKYEIGIIINPLNEFRNRLLREKEDTCKFKIVDHQLKFFGYCEDCQKKREMKS